ncbi:unnamed protein product, partial [Onchocerca flexuosa]|uniref:Golgi apparatus membrane protein TVP23 homolog n=1 Tax=Onchocerca flexuosa TaxID=387005 RepID=A0A183HIE2_9BILA
MDICLIKFYNHETIREEKRRETAEGITKELVKTKDRLLIKISLIKTNFLFYKNHPSIVFSHVIFRSAAVFFYVFAYFFTDSFIIHFLVILILLSIDFWT